MNKNPIETDDLQNFREQWRLLNDRFGNMRKDMSTLRVRSADSSRQRLIQRSRRLLLLCLLAPTMLAPLCNEGLPLWIACFFMFYFLIMGIAEAILIRMLKKLDITRMPVAEALDRVYRIISFRRCAQALGISMAIPLLLSMLWHFAGESRAMLVGGIVGLIVGAVVGIFADREIRRLLRSMKEELRELADSDDEP